MSCGFVAALKQGLYQASGVSMISVDCNLSGAFNTKSLKTRVPKPPLGTPRPVPIERAGTPSAGWPSVCMLKSAKAQNGQLNQESIRRCTLDVPALERYPCWTPTDLNLKVGGVRQHRIYSTPMALNIFGQLR